MALLHRLARGSSLLRRLLRSPPPPSLPLSACKSSHPCAAGGGEDEDDGAAASLPIPESHTSSVPQHDLTVSLPPATNVDAALPNLIGLVEAIRSFEGSNMSQMYMKINQRGVQDPFCRYVLARGLNTQSGNSSSKSDVDLDGRRQRINRLLYRSRQRGYLELDLILGKWTEENIEKLDERQLEFLVEVLDLENPELWKWLSGQEVAPESLKQNPVFAEIHKQILEDLSKHSPIQTRAKLGQPWVRGWDDNRKVGGPQAGNQQ